MLRNLYRRRLRTGLTVVGIAVGILAFTVMGGMAEKITMIIRGGEAYFSHRIAIRSIGGTVRLNILGQEDIMVVQDTPGVREVETQIILPLDETAGFELSPRFLVGIDLLNFARAQRLGGTDARLLLRQGRWWQPGQQQVAVLGSAIARKMKLNVGDTLEARGQTFEVTGLLQETLSLPDGWALIPQEDARALLTEASSLYPFAELGAVVTNAYALIDPSEGDQVTAALADRLRKGFLLYSPQQLTEAAGQASTLLNTAILGSGIVAVIVGALSVINTMLVAVAERTREIGIKKAVGATRWDIIRELLQESTALGTIGGLLGVGLGIFVTLSVNWYTREQGTPIFLVTPRLALWGVGFAAILGTGAGILPALRAASLDPVEALREL